jgi:hypothetical protein
MFKTGTSLSRSLKLLPAAGAIAGVLALAGTALTQEAPSKDEVFSATTAIVLPGKTIAAFDIQLRRSGAIAATILPGRPHERADRYC